MERTHRADAGHAHGDVGASDAAIVDAQSLLDSSPESAYRAIVAAAAAALDAPIAALSIFESAESGDVVDSRCVCHVGLDVGEGPVDLASLVAVVEVAADEVVAADVATDDRFGLASIDLDGHPPAMYVGIPFVDGFGRLLGVLHVADRVRRLPDAAQLEMVRGLAESLRQIVWGRRVAMPFDGFRRAIELFEAGFERTAVGMQLLTKDGVFLRVNQAFADMVGRPISDVVGKNWRDVTLQDDITPTSAIDAKMAAGEVPVYCDVKRYVRPDGSLVWGVVSIVPVFLGAADQPDDRVHFTQVVDVTSTVAARENAERLSREVVFEQRRFRMAWEHAPAGIALVDELGQLVDVNARMCEMTLRPRSELIGLPLDQFVHTDGEGGHAVLRRDGTRCEVKFERAVLDGIDGGTESLVHLVDISSIAAHERAQRELLAEQRSTLESARALDRFKSSLVSTVSHELRTPLTSMLGYVELLTDDSALSERQQHLVEVVERNGQRLLSVVEDLLIASGLEHGGLKIEPTPVSLPALVEDVFEMMGPLACRADVHLTSDHDLDLPTISGDRKMLERVIVNLVSNGIKFTPPGGTIDVTSKLSDDGSDVVISVSDTGVGIPLDEQPQLFRRFFRARAANEQLVPGSGLGLSITAELVRAHNGSIDLRSEVGTGTTVSVSLPTAGAELPPDPDALVAPNGSSERNRHVTK